MNCLIRPDASHQLRLLGVDPDDFVQLRRRLHACPELGFQEERTSELVAQSLAQWGYAVERGIGGTGVVGQLKRGRGSRHIGIRADMDALPMGEESGQPWTSQVQGVMHACGHDGHTAMLLCAAKALAAEPSLNGTLTLIFQPAEEVGGQHSGAVRMIEDGLFEKYPVDAIFAMHNVPAMAQGVLAFRDGAAFASSDRAVVTLTGKGGHGAMPHLAADPVVCAASLVMALQTVVSRNVDPVKTAVVTVGCLRAGSSDNVIPQEAHLALSIRALEPAVRDLLEKRIYELARDQARSFGIHADVNYIRGYSPLINSSSETSFARQVAIELVGLDNTIAQHPPFTGSEDFAFMLERKPGCYLLIGNGETGLPGGCMVHSPNYDFNDDNVAVGAAFWHLLAKRHLV